MQANILKAFRLTFFLGLFVGLGVAPHPSFSHVGIYATWLKNLILVY